MITGGVSRPRRPGTLVTYISLFIFGCMLPSIPTSLSWAGDMACRHCHLAGELPETVGTAWISPTPNPVFLACPGLKVVRDQLTLTGNYLQALSNWADHIAAGDQVFRELKTSRDKWHGFLARPNDFSGLVSGASQIRSEVTVGVFRPLAEHLAEQRRQVAVVMVTVLLLTLFVLIMVRRIRIRRWRSFFSGRF